MIQALLSLRLIWSNTAFNDEALYLWAGRLELQHLEHGTVIQPFQTYFSGSPVIYPPLAALANEVGGLAGARLLSLIFMLGATLLVYGATRRLFDPAAGLIAAAVFAATGSVQFIGSFATYDAMALFLMALAAWLVIMARGRLSEPLLILGAAVLVLANATKYPSALWDPVMVLLAGLTAAQPTGTLRKILRSARFGAYTALGIAVALHLGGHAYLRGILYTTLTRSSSSVPAQAILRDAGLWVGLIFVIALRGVIIADSRRKRLLMLTLAVAVVLAPLEQARIHTLTSLDKHAAFGAWFGAIAVGFVLADAMRTSKYLGWRLPAGTATIILALGLWQSGHFFQAWPNARPAVTAIARAEGSNPSPILSEQGPVVSYYLNDAAVTSTLAFGYWDGHHYVRGRAAYVEAIRQHYFGVIEIDFSFAARSARDVLIMNTLRHTPGYQLVARIPWSADNPAGLDVGGSDLRDFQVWRRTNECPSLPGARICAQHHAHAVLARRR